jgi:uncharacterized membrane protein YhiD involved in acid resistance
MVNDLRETLMAGAEARNWTGAAILWGTIANGVVCKEDQTKENAIVSCGRFIIP